MNPKFHCDPCYLTNVLVFGSISGCIRAVKHPPLVQSKPVVLSWRLGLTNGFRLASMEYFLRHEELHLNTAFRSAIASGVIAEGFERLFSRNVMEKVSNCCLLFVCLICFFLLCFPVFDYLFVELEIVWSFDFTQWNAFCRDG
jgi:hypothetical protein